MRTVKSERLKKLEAELNDLEQWLKLGLVPKSDIEKHQVEIESVKEKIQEEKDRLQFLKESGEIEEYVTPKKGGTRTGFTEMPTIPDIDMAETATHGYDSSSSQEETVRDEETDSDEDEDTESEDKETESDEEDIDEESYFSDKNRWKRGSGILDPDADNW